MGGNALKSIDTRRVDAAEFQALVPAVLDTLAGIVGRDRPLCVIEAYRHKPDFGDMDVLVSADGLADTYKDEIAAAFGSREVYRNGNVTSFDRNGFQIDLIAIPAQSFDFARAYFAWNDLGNLVGRIAHKMGLKFGFEGLHAPLRDGDHMFAEVLVTHDVDQALSFLGYDAARYREGFDTLEDIFRFTASTRFFNPDIYLLENRNATSRMRDAKRKTYSAFLDWLAAPGGLAAARPAPAEGWYRFADDKTSWRPALRQAFPDFGDRLDTALARKARHESAAAIFNGRRVGDITGLTGQALGELMRTLRQPHAGTDALDDWVLAQGEAGVRQAIEQAAAALKPQP